MNRNFFLKSLVLTGTFLAFHPGKLLNLFEEEVSFELPFIDGKYRKVSVIKHRASIVEELAAQSNYQANYINPGYSYFAPTNYYDYNRAMAIYQQQLIQQQQYYAWLNSQYINQWNQMMKGYGNKYSQFGAPAVMPVVKSVYSLVNNYGEPALVGLNHEQRHVVVEDSTLGGSTAFEWINRRYGRTKAERTAAPQTNEKGTLIDLTAFGVKSATDAMGYGTEEGKVKVSDADNFVTGNYQGQLVEVEHYNGKEYLIV